MDQNLIVLGIIDDGMPEIHLLTQEVLKVKTSQTTIATLRRVAKKLKIKIEKILELAQKANLSLFHKIVYMQYEKYLIFYGFVQRLPKKISQQKATRLLMMYKVMQVEDLTKLIDVYINMEADINNKILPKPQAKDLFANDKNFIDFVNRSYGEEEEKDKENFNKIFNKIINNLYVWQDGVGPVQKSMMKCPIHIVLPGNKKK